MSDGRIGNSNQTLQISGVVSAPAYSFASDNNTGLYRIGANNIGVAADGSKVLDIATTGLTVTGAFAASNGVSSTLTTDASSSSTGSIVTAGGISTQKALWVGTTSRLVGAVTADAGISSTLTTDASSSSTGSIVTAGGISTQKALWVGTTSRLVGAVTADAGITVSGGAAATNTWTGASGGSLPVTALAAATGANRYLVTVTFKGVLLNTNGTTITPAITITLKNGSGGSTIGTARTYTKTVAISYGGVFVVSLSQMVSQPSNNAVEAAITDTEGDGGSHSWSDIDVQISVCNMQLG
jgi:hypothetical protein